MFIRVADWSEYEDDEFSYYIQAFGRLESGESVYLQISGFEPYFYIRVPDVCNTFAHAVAVRDAVIDCIWDQRLYTDFLAEEGSDSFKAKDKVKSTYRRLISKIEFCDKEDFMAGFQNHKKTRCAKLYFKTASAMSKVASIWSSGKRLPKIGMDKFITQNDVFEANLTPLLRFFHTRHIDPAGTLEVSDSDLLELSPIGWTSCKKAFQIQADKVSPCTDVAVNIPLCVAAWDIECFSDHGGFPSAEPTYRRLATAVADSLSSMNNIRNLILSQKWKKPPTDQRIATILKNLEVKLAEWKTVSDETELVDDIESFLKSCMPAIQGDPIIQIGVVVRNSNDMDKTIGSYILTLGGCEAWPDIESNTVIKTYATELELLKGFANLIRLDIDPDILCGYNDFGFDYKYLFDRADQLTNGNGGSVMTLSRVADDDGACEMKHHKLEVASGQFDLNYIDIEGRLQIDMLVVMRREQNLDSYTLDNVSSVFMRDDVKSITDGISITSKGGIRGLKAGDFVRFEVIKNSATPINDGKKYQVSLVEGKTFKLVESLTNYDPEDPIQWTLAKDDLKPQELFKCHMGTDSDRGRIAKYCIMDCGLVLNLMSKLDTIVNAAGMANVCHVPLGWLYLRGQGIKAYSLVVYECTQRNQVVLTQRVDRSEQFGDGPSYEGAFVLDPITGIHLEPVAVTDFNSLYPSEMIARNLSHDSWVWTKEYDTSGNLIKMEGGKQYEAVEGETYFDRSYDLKNSDGVVVGKTVCRFRQPKGDDDFGTIPVILKKLLRARKDTRKRMEKLTDEFQISVLNGLQLAYKVTANSMYGQLGSRTSPIRKMCLAACTTAGGRENLMIAKKVVEEKYGATVVYGDSVSGDTALFLKTTEGSIITARFDELSIILGKVWVSGWHTTKESIELPEGWLVWSDVGWTGLHRIIRHRLAPGKRMFRILTHTGVVDATEDHSLIHMNGNEIKPSEVSIGTNLLHSDILQGIKNIETKTDITVDEAWVMGFFMADGSCDTYSCPSGVKSSWAINKLNTDLLTEAQNKCPFETKIIDTVQSSGVYKLVPTGEKTRKIVEKYRSMFYNKNREKIVPNEILTAHIDIVKSFWNGFYAGDGDHCSSGNCRFDQKGKQVCLGLNILARRLGYTVSINERSDKPTVFRLTMTTSKQRKNPNAIKRIYEIPTTDIDYVYDCTTENHHFHVGPGNLVVSNTDSIFMKFNLPSGLSDEEKMKETIRLAQEATGHINVRVSKPHNIEYEKTFYPFILLRRKGYVGNKYEHDPHKYKKASMGVVLKRRDNADIVKDIYGGAIDIILNKRDIKLAQKFVMTELKKMIDGLVSLEKLVVTKSLRDDYKNPATVAHYQLAKRMGERDPANKPKAGDRIAFVFVENPKATKTMEKMEDVNFVRDNPTKAKIDYLHYITDQIQNPVAQLFRLAIEQLDGYKKPKNYFPALAKSLKASGLSEEKVASQIEKEKDKILEELMFTNAPYLKTKVIEARNAGKGQRTISMMFTGK